MTATLLAPPGPHTSAIAPPAAPTTATAGTSMPPCTPQSPARVVMVRPHHFRVHPGTRADNAFAGAGTVDAHAAYRQVSALAAQLEAAGIGVDLFEDTGTATPDSVFPNNWFSTHDDGRMVLYPMYAAHRRAERRWDVIEHLRRTYRVSEVVDLSGAERERTYLEGTGAMVLDHLHRTAYGCFSNRLTPSLFTRWCREFGYDPVLFRATDDSGVEVYHTNVMMSIGSSLALVGSEMIRSRYERRRVLETLAATGRTVIELSEAQVRSFAANALELSSPNGPVLAISATAYAGLTVAVRRRIAQHARILVAEVDTIERAGGSVRCMLAGNHLPAR